MLMFIWGTTEPVSTTFHDNGGLNIVASSLGRARELWTVYAITKGIKAGACDREPDYTYLLSEKVDEQVLVFPNSGCC